MIEPTDEMRRAAYDALPPEVRVAPAVLGAVLGAALAIVERDYLTGAQLNDLCAELSTARKLREVLGRYEVHAFTVTGVPADVALDHDCSRWAVHIDQPIPLAELVQRAEEHAEVCE